MILSLSIKHKALRANMGHGSTVPVQGQKQKHDGAFIWLRRTNAVEHDGTALYGHGAAVPQP
jgi:hypothetical protein